MLGVRCWVLGVGKSSEIRLSGVSEAAIEHNCGQECPLSLPRNIFARHIIVHCDINYRLLKLAPQSEQSEPCGVVTTKT